LPGGLAQRDKPAPATGDPNRGDPVFEPELFGLKASDYQQFATGLVTPALGFLFLYLLALPLRKLPFLSVDIKYRPPSWVLPLFAIGSMFALSLALSLAGFLNYFRAHPSVEAFKQSFLKERHVAIPVHSGRLREAAMTLSAYDGFSNFRIIVNGYRMLGSSSDCRFTYQCKPPSPSAAADFKAVQDAKLTDRSILHIHRMYTLPFKIDIIGFLVNGPNFIDVLSDNSGLGDCRLETALTLRFDAVALEQRINVLGEVGTSGIETAAANTTHTFYAGGNPGVQEDGTIEPYGTKTANGSYRVCERVRLLVDLSKSRVAQTEAEWRSWMAERHRAAICEARNYQREYCRDVKRPQ
jgi:hypothetical protein